MSTHERDLVFAFAMSRQMQNWIDLDYFMVTLYRANPGPARDGMGGRDYIANPQAQSAQKVRIIPSRSRSTNLIYTTPAGQIVSTKDALMIGLPNLNAKLFDWFTWQGVDYQVSFINPDRRWMTVCQLDLLGETYRQTV